MNDEVAYLILSIVLEIPCGYVSTYGDIAKFAGMPKNSRLVGKILSMSEYFGDFPCHRVVNHKGRVAPSFKMQKELLLNEGVTFKNEWEVDLNKHRWHP